MRLNKMMDVIGNSELEVKVRAADADLVMEGFQKIANRVSSGIILATLIIVASLLMRVDTPFQLFGYAGLAILCFLAAAAGGFWLVIGIFIQDQKSKKKLPRWREALHTEWKAVTASPAGKRFQDRYRRQCCSIDASRLCVRR